MNGHFALVPGPTQVLPGRGPMVPRDANAGLVWARYLAMWEGTPERPRPPKEIKPVLDAFANGFNERGTGARNPARDLLRLNRERLERALNAWVRPRRWSAVTLNARVSWRLVTGLGNPHPAGVNLAFDSTIGVPFLPGSTVKGLCRQAAAVLDEPESAIDRLFGPEIVVAQDRTMRGQVAFFDAYPRRWPTLVVDLINCHHPDYYGQSAIDQVKGPAETESPVPVTFLCIGEGTDFVFPLAAASAGDLQHIREILTSGLEILGIGGKTAVGYGVMASAPPAPDSRRRDG